jgi:hypothetical protein
MIAMIATTIISSMRVKPARLEVRIVAICLLLPWETHRAPVGVPIARLGTGDYRSRVRASRLVSLYVLRRPGGPDLSDPVETGCASPPQRGRKSWKAAPSGTAFLVSNRSRIDPPPRLAEPEVLNSTS